MSSRRVSGLGRAIGDPSRAEILHVLHGGRPRSAGELASYLGLAPSTTSRHLAVLLDAGLVAVEAEGRHRYFRLSNHEIGELLNLIDTMDLPETPAARPRSTSRLATLRTCYDHLAGELAVRIYESMTTKGLLDPPDGDGPRLTARGHVHLAALGIETRQLGTQPRPLVRACLDWELHTHHLGGAVGAALLEMMINEGWLTRARHDRSVAVTPRGTRRFDEHFDLADAESGAPVD